METKKPMIRRRRRKRGTGRKYFTQVHEDAILEYVATNDIAVRTRLYINYIGPAFDEMVDKIVYTYKFNNLPNIDSLKDECKIWLVTILDKYDPAKGSKAFSYFSVITKNWFIHKVKKKSKRNRTEVDVNEMPKELELRHCSTTNPYMEDRARDEFLLNLKANMIDWESDCEKPNDEKVMQAIQILFEQADKIEIFNKKAIYLYLRELTGLNTKQVVTSLKKVRVKYKNFKIDWDGD